MVSYNILFTYLCTCCLILLSKSETVFTSSLQEAVLTNASADLFIKNNSDVEEAKASIPAPIVITSVTSKDTKDKKKKQRSKKRKLRKKNRKLTALADLNGSAPLADIDAVNKSGFFIGRPSSPVSSDVDITENPPLTTDMSNTLDTTTSSPDGSSTVLLETVVHPSLKNASLSVSPTSIPCIDVRPSGTFHIVIITICLLALAVSCAVIGFFLRKRSRQLEQQRLQLLPVYNYDPTDEQEDWESRLISEAETSIDKIVQKEEAHPLAEVV